MGCWLDDIRTGLLAAWLLVYLRKNTPRQRSTICLTGLPLSKPLNRSLWSSIDMEPLIEEICVIPSCRLVDWTHLLA